jgi:Uma2 family endonuclease
MTLTPTRLTQREEPSTQIEPKLQSLELFAGRKRWTRADCEFLERLGMLPDRFELIDGEIINKMGQNIPHGTCVMRAILWLSGIFGIDMVLTQISVEVLEGDQIVNRPEPDVLVLSKPAQEYERIPPAADLQLIIEVSDTTLRDDLQIKAPLYARAGVPEYWVLDVIGRQLFIHRNAVDGNYSLVERFQEGDSVATEAATEHSIPLVNLLPPEPVEAQ